MRSVKPDLHVSADLAAIEANGATPSQGPTDYAYGCLYPLLFVRVPEIRDAEAFDLAVLLVLRGEVERAV